MNNVQKESQLSVFITQKYHHMIVCPTINMSSVEPVCSGPVVQLSGMFDSMLNVQPEILYMKRKVTQQPSAPSAVPFLSSSIRPSLCFLRLYILNDVNAGLLW